MDVELNCIDSSGSWKKIVSQKALKKKETEMEEKIERTE